MSETAVPHQRLAARAVLRRGGQVLLARISGAGYGTAGTWTLPGGGVDHGEHPEVSLRREVLEETGLDIVVGHILGVYSRRFTGLSPLGMLEDFHGIHLVYAATITSDHDVPRVLEVDGTTDDVGWVEVDDIRQGRLVEISDVVGFALDLDSR